MKSDWSLILSYASEAISRAPVDSFALKGWGQIGIDLARALQERNGFYAFESALLLRPFQRLGQPLGIVEWNEPALWKSSYELDTEALFFAEDAFGVQFCIRGDTVSSFEPETGGYEELATSFDGWIHALSLDLNTRVGFPIAQKWQRSNGALKCGERLLPKLPFVLGGKFENSNLYSLSDVDGMRLRASIANQIKNVPDGGQVVIELTRPKDLGKE